MTLSLWLPHRVRTVRVQPPRGGRGVRLVVKKGLSESERCIVRTLTAEAGQNDLEPSTPGPGDSRCTVRPHGSGTPWSKICSRPFSSPPSHADRLLFCVLCTCFYTCSPLPTACHFFFSPRNSLATASLDIIWPRPFNKNNKRPSRGDIRCWDCVRVKPCVEAMTLTRNSSHRNPDDFPTAQLFLLGKPTLPLPLPP